MELETRQSSALFFPTKLACRPRACTAGSRQAHISLIVTLSLPIRRPVLVWSSLLFLICIHASKTVRRNADWQSEHTLFLSGLKVNQRNAKLYNNVGHCLETQGKFSEALSYFNTAISVEPNDIGAYINVGRTQTQLGMYEEAERAFRKVCICDLLKPRKLDLYDIFCAVLYVLKSACQWRMLPKDFPKCFWYF
ncbi:Transmembrane and TPR repeat-containing protein CG4050 [Araneus ventricosus]|uniref:Transmembrane and TPR repeat-containing protein CG4050 n=1 Tax=Araneus ventricosus TaxID=182803 RepID=A0A4Y2NRA9_ARAVE|nr:Transmembrane and TPR repeat-containing protein CG4050 [Araneus ventricosus]